MSSRRQTLQWLGGGALLATLPPPLLATPAMRDAAVAELTGGAPIHDADITLTIPAIAENGLSVYTTVAVDSPMTADDHVRAIHILAEANPIARLVSFRLGPRAGRAQVSSNIRLAGSQRVTALAELSDGTFRRDARDVVVTLAACIDGG